MDISKIIDAKTGIIRAEIRLHGTIVKKTMFPDNWGPEKVMAAAESAMKNVFETEAGLEGRLIFRGKTDEGMVIELIVEEAGEVIVFYPKINGV